jgi:hypothetical protein
VKWKYTLLAFSLFVASTFGAPRDSRWIDDPATRVSVVLEGTFTADPLIWDSMESELRRIFAPVDAEFILHSPLDRALHQEFDTDLIVLRISGTCSVGPMPPIKPHRPSTLGRTFVTDGVILPFVELDCRQISGAIRERVLGLQREQRLRMLGIAMGRVLAHEIYHVLARTPEHSPSGIAAEALGPDQLTGRTLDFLYEDFARMGLVDMVASD